MKENSVDVNAQDEDDQTPLHYAVQNEAVECIKQLLTCKDINVRIENDFGLTALELAQESQSLYRDMMVSLLTLHDAAEDSNHN